MHRGDRSCGPRNPAIPPRRQRGDEIYERAIRPHVETTHYGKVVVIDIDSESYIIADNALAASERLLMQHPEAEIWCVRVGHRALHHIGGRPIKRNPCRG